MATGQYLPTGRFQAPLREKLADELLYAIFNGHLDAEACRAELKAQGWTERHITVGLLGMKDRIK